MPSTGTRVAVALGAGGARGYAHIGVLQVLAERGHEVVALAGTSMGALVAGVAAAGRLAPYTEWSLSLTQREVIRLLDPTLSGGGAIRAERVIGKVGEILDGARIEDCAIPYTAVATDLGARREVWFQRGPVITAIRASVSIPGVITPVVVDGRLLVDGGLINPVPIEPTAAVTSDWTLAVSLSGPRVAGGLGLTGPEQASASPVRMAGEAVRALSHRFSSRRHGPDPAGGTSDTDAGDTDTSATSATSATGDEGSGAAPPTPEPEDPGYAPGPKDLGTMDVFNRSFDTMASLITRYRMAGNPPDVLVTVPSDACRTMDFHRAEEMIALGRRLTEEALDAAGR